MKCSKCGGKKFIPSGDTCAPAYITCDHCHGTGEEPVKDDTEKPSDDLGFISDDNTQAMLQLPLKPFTKGR